MGTGKLKNLKRNKKGQFVSDIDFSDEQENEIVNKYQEGESSRSIAEDFNASSTKILKVLRNAGQVVRAPAHLRNDIGFEEGNKPPNYVKREIPEPWHDIDTAYVFGVLIGDASICFEDGTPRGIELDTPNQDFRTILSKAVESAFGISTCKYFCENPPRIAAYSTDLGRAYDKFKWRKYIWRIPEAFFDASREMKIALCQGKFDSDGGPDRKAISIGSVRKKGLRDLRRLVKSLGYESSLTGPYPPSRFGNRVFFRLRIPQCPPEFFRLPEKRKTLKANYG